MHGSIQHHAQRKLKIVTIHGGELYASKEPVRIHTLLGSCIATCLFDPTTSIGGMNHFLLPGKSEDTSLSARYGIHAMEILINAMMKLGANRYELCAKIFGGGDVLHAQYRTTTIGRTNIEFIKRFLSTEQIPVLAHRIGGQHGLVIHYYTDSFDVFVRTINMEKFHKIQAKELAYQKTLSHQIQHQADNNITLF